MNKSFSKRYKRNEDRKNILAHFKKQKRELNVASKICVIVSLNPQKRSLGLMTMVSSGSKNLQPFKLVLFIRFAKACIEFQIPSINGKRDITRISQNYAIFVAGLEHSGKETFASFMKANIGISCKEITSTIWDVIETALKAVIHYD